MILTVTANSALDKVIFIEEFIPTTDMRSRWMVESVGGKGFDTSVVLKSMGIDTLALGIMAGFTGKQLERVLERYGFPLDLVWVDGETRVANVIVETLHYRQSHVTSPGYPASEVAAAELSRRFCAHLPGASWAVAGGSLPEGIRPDFYARLIELANQAGKPFLLDCAGEPMRLAAAARPAVMKMNRSELGQTFGVRAGGVEELAAAIRDFRAARDLPALVVTCGKDGLLASTPEGEFLAASPPQEEINSAGAGDAASAAIPWRLSLGEPWPEALRWGAAVSAAVVLTPGTADCSPADVARILPDTRVRRL